MKSSVASSSDGSGVSWPICPGDHLIDRRLVRGRPRPRSSSARCRSATSPARCAWPPAAGSWRPSRPLTTHNVVAEALERLQRRRELEARAPVAGVHWSHASRRAACRPRRSGGPVRRRSATGRQRRHHRVEQRQRQGGAHAVEKRPTRQRFLVMNISRPSAERLAAPRRGRRHLERHASEWNATCRERAHDEAVSAAGGVAHDRPARPACRTCSRPRPSA